MTSEDTKPPKPKKKTTTMSGVKYEWCVIRWNGTAWKKVTAKTGDFAKHYEECEKLKAENPPGHIKSIHVCWLDDIKNWDGPDVDVIESLKDKLSTPPGERIMSPQYGSQESVIAPPGVLTEDVIMESAARLDSIGHRLDVELEKLSPHDRREFRRFQKYLAARQRYGDEVLLKRKFWRKYLGIDETT